MSTSQTLAHLGQGYPKPDSGQGTLYQNSNPATTVEIHCKNNNISDALGINTHPCSFINALPKQQDTNSIKTSNAIDAPGDIDTMDNISTLDDINCMANVEEEIDSRLPYRIGWPILPVLPVATTVVTQNPFANSHMHLRTICDIAGSHNIDMQSVNVLHRATCGADTNSGRDTVVLLANYNGDKDEWIKTVIKIREHFAASQIDLAIELIDERAAGNTLQVSPIASTDRSIMKAWRELVPTLTSTIRAQGHDCRTIDMLYREFPSRSQQPTIIISARDANNTTWWDETLPSLRQLPQVKNLNLDIVLLSVKDIFFANGETDTHAETNADIGANADSVNNILKNISLADVEKTDGGTEAHEAMLRESYENPLNMGSSCGIDGEEGSGTLGGRIKLQVGGSVLQLGLTNYHVVRHALQGETLPAVLPSFFYGPVVSPSDRDHKAMLKIQKDDKKLKGKHLGAMVRQYRAIEPGNDLFSKSFERRLSDYFHLAKGIESAKVLPRHIGNIYAATGYAMGKNIRYKNDESQNWALDWALIRLLQPGSTIARLKAIITQLKETRAHRETTKDQLVAIEAQLVTTENQLHAIFDRPSTISSEIQMLPSNTEHIREDENVTQYCTISANETYNVMKRGRTSGWTKGTISGCDGVVYPGNNHPRVKATPTNQKVELKEFSEPVYCYTIICNEGAFLQHGDSGSFVLLDEETDVPGIHIAGLSFAGNDATRTYYMMPMDLVVESIEEVTGGTVTEPQYVGQVQKVKK